MIGQLKPKIIKPKPRHTPQRQAVVDPPTHATMRRHDRYKRLRPTFDPDRCQRESTVEIDGKPYWRIQAGSMALERWLRGELTESKVDK
jgi:hypothetical protein